MGSRTRAALIAAATIAGASACGHIPAHATATTDTLVQLRPDKTDTVGFGQVRTYKDGLSVAVSDVRPFRPDPAILKALQLPVNTIPVRYTLTLSNGSKVPWRTDQMGVHAVPTGSPTDAPAVCDLEQHVPCENGTIIKPGQVASMVFGIGLSPSDDQGVTIEVTPDSEHDPATWAGSFTTRH